MDVVNGNDSEHKDKIGICIGCFENATIDDLCCAGSGILLDGQILFPFDQIIKKAERNFILTWGKNS